MDGQTQTDERWRAMRRQRILEAARLVFARAGFDAASMDDIAFEAGMGKPTLYRYYGGKEKLFDAVFIDALDRLEEALDDAAARERNGRERLRMMISAIVPSFREHLASLRTLSGNAAGVERGQRSIFRRRREGLETRLANAIAYGIETRAFRAIDTRMTAKFVIGMAWSGSVAGRPDEDVSTALCNLLFSGLTSPEGSRT
jgi:AcrR family transcriptional regulator